MITVILAPCAPNTREDERNDTYETNEDNMRP